MHKEKKLTLGKGGGGAKDPPPFLVYPLPSRSAATADPTIKRMHESGRYDILKIIILQTTSWTSNPCFFLV